MSELLLTLHLLIERQCRANQSNVCKRLRKVAKRVARFGVDLFTIKSDVVLVIKQRLHQLPAFSTLSAAKREIFGLPKTTDCKSSFGRVGTVPVQQPVAGTKILANGLISGLHSWRICFLESVPGQQEQARVEVFTVE